ncbi:MAG: DUF1634 domain-containing protein [Elusimicrobiales bacterium]|nr:DUF1634 domain-containing protein [Elusimicrobiales bacterium]
MKRIVRELLNHETEIIIGNLLRAGVIAAAAVVSLGGVIYLFHHGLEPVNYRVFHRQPPDLSCVGGILKDAAAGQGRGLIQLGLLILIATPIARVGFSVFAFARQKDRLYVLVTLIVLAILVYSLMGK